MATEGLEIGRPGFFEREEICEREVAELWK